MTVVVSQTCSYSRGMLVGTKVLYVSSTATDLPKAGDQYVTTVSTVTSVKVGSGISTVYVYATDS